MKINKVISPLISSQFPQFYQTEGPNFVAFMEAYYEWLEQDGQVINQARSLFEYTDIDTTLPTFIKYFKNTYMNSLPDSVIADKALLTKHILELYRTKGTPRAYKLLFRMFFNEDVDIFIPANYLFKLSDNKWTIPTYIEITAGVFHELLIGHKIVSSSGNASAIVELHFTKNLNNRVIHVLQISNLEGNFKHGERLFCPDLFNKDGSLVINDLNAPLILGSLSSISIINGGDNFNVGDLLNVYGNGNEAVAKIVKTTFQNGKLIYNLENGGFGYSTNAIVTISSGGGTGGNFSVGSITNKTVYQINQDVINTYYNTTLDVLSQGFTFSVSNTTGNMTIGEVLHASGNAVFLDVTKLTGTGVSNNESLSNASLGIANLVAYNSQDSCLFVTSTQAQLTNANLVPGTILISNTSATSVKINTNFGLQVISGNATVVSSNSTIIVANTANGGFLPYTTATGLTSSKTAFINTVSRNTDWLFPFAVASALKSNLDSPIVNVLQFITLIVGTITSIINENPGSGYAFTPTITIVEPLIASIEIPDGQGGFWGQDAVVSATAGTANGIAVAVQVISSGYGYQPNEILTLQNDTNSTSVTGAAIIDLNGVLEGSWHDTKSFLSDDQVLQDSYFWQDFSYQILANRMIDTYEDFVQNLIHPSGIKMFGKYVVKDTIPATVSNSSYFALSTVPVPYSHYEFEWYVFGF